MPMLRRFHTFKDSGSNNLLVADSLARVLEFGPRSSYRKYQRKLLSIEGSKQNYGRNDTFDYQVPSTVLPADIAKELRNLADSLCKLANSVFVLGTKSWQYRGLSNEIYNDYHSGTDSIQ